MRIKSFRQTNFITVNDMNEIKIEIEGWDFCNKFEVEISIDEKVVCEKRKYFSETIEILIPTVSEECRCTVKVWPFMEKSIEKSFSLSPPQKITVGFLYSSHEDLGYCGYANKLGAECANYLSAALDIYEKNKDFKYFIEHYWWLDGFAKYASENDKERLKKAFADGAFELSVPHSGVHTHWQDYERTVRNIYPACINAKRWGIIPQTVVYADISGMSWSAVQAYSEAGIKYVMILENGNFRKSYDDEINPRLFRWIAPDGKNSLLCFRQNGYKGLFRLSEYICDLKRQYDEGDFNFDDTKARRIAEEITNIIDSFGDVKTSYIPVSFYDDREVPTSMLLTVCSEMNKRFKYPHFEMTLPGECMKKIETEIGNAIPCLHGDMTDQWADFMTIAPEWNRRKRQADRNVAVAEILSSVFSLERKPYPVGAIDNAIWKMCEFDEHCWATSSSNPLNMHRYNLHLMKKSNAYYAEKVLCKIIRERTSSNGGFLRIWNFAPYRRKCSVITESVPNGVLSQRMSDGRYITESIELPAFGYKTFLSDRAEVKESIRVYDGKIDTGHYILKINYESCNITGIYDKSNGREYIDEDAEYYFGEFIYAYSTASSEMPSAYYTASRRGLAVYDGSYAVQVIITSYEEQSGANVKTVITFKKESPEIEIEFSFENAVTLIGDKNDRYKKNLFFALPLKVENHECITELAGGVCRENRDRLKMNPYDYVVARGWTAVQNDEFGIGIYSKDMPVYHFGAINYNRLSSKSNTERSSSIYIYVASNRCNQLNFMNKEDCCGRYRVSLLPYNGEWENILPRWSSDCDYEPYVACGTVLEEKSYIEIDKENVRLITLKKAENKDAFLLRLIENAGEECDVNIRLPFEIESAEYTDTVENRTGNFPQYSENKLSIRINKFGYANIIIVSRNLSDIEILPEKQEVYNIFSYVYENTKTLVGFEKKGLEKVKAFDVECDGITLCRVENEKYDAQYVEIDGVYNGEFTVKPVI